VASIFMSFIHEEESTANYVQEFIHEVLGDGVDSFRSSDETAIYAGEDWMGRIFEELKAAKILISMLSPDSVKRPWINFEAGAAWMNNTRVIPVCFGGLTISDLPKPYSSLQAVEIETHSGSYYLVSSIAHYLNIDRPEQPIFSDNPAALILGTTDPEKNKKLFAPYKRLRGLLNFYRDLPSTTN
jgi:TIR domain